MSRWKQQRRLVAVILALGLMSACDRDSPTRPSLTGGVTLYEHPDYRGASYMLTHDDANLDTERGPCRATTNPAAGRSWDECVSAISVAEGWRAVVFEDDNYSGRSRTFTANVANLRGEMGGPDSCDGGWNDCISSLRVSRID